MTDRPGASDPPFDPAAVDAAAIDWARVAELRSEIGDDEFAEVVELFLAEADAMIEAFAGQPTTDYEEALHALKGSSLNLGLSGLAGICRRGERLASEGRAHEVPVTQVLTGYAMARAALLAGLDAGKDSAPEQPP